MDKFSIDLWTIWGLIAQGFFFLSFVFQWYKSEKTKTSYLPTGFWYLRLIGAVMLLVYVFKRQDLVFFISSILQIIIYLRNLILHNKSNVEEI